MDELEKKKSKPRVDLLPGKALMAAGRVMSMGEAKHGQESWRKYPPEVFIAALGRHYAAITSGEFIDRESGECHMAHIICNAMFLTDFFERGIIKIKTDD